VNFTPVLLEQLEELARRTTAHLRDGAELPDPVLALLSERPLPQEPAERLDLLRACMKAQRERMIERFAPYRELVAVATPLATLERVAYASDRLLRDLGVWYHLAWLGESVRRADARVAQLMEAAGSYSTEQRRELLGIVSELLDSIIPRFRRLAEAGRCELSVTPWGHPILPLLFDFEAARESSPAAELPQAEGYPDGADRAEWHMAEAVRVFTETFGFRPEGCWPSEAAVSDSTLALIERHGFRWAASSAGVLRGSLVRSGLIDRTHHGVGLFDRPYHLEGGRLPCFFRNDGLSDLIGFTYATWHADDAVRHLAHELERIARQPDGDPTRLVLIALDGENAWEHYPFNGHYFLSALYETLAGHPLLELTTLSAHLRREPQSHRLPRLVAGSWVHGTLDTWMGDASKNAAWDLLCEAKRVFDRVVVSGALSAKSRTEAERQLALCESSDWFWWFGDYNPAEAVGTFDRLYRHQLEVLYRMLDVAPPLSLKQPISSGRGAPEHGGVMRRAHAE
jgi:alpha-amylase/alpha-mannosidase (GH57 family)